MLRSVVVVPLAGVEDVVGGVGTVVFVVGWSAADSLPASVFWCLYRHLVQPEIPAGGVDVFGCTRQVADQLLRLEESHTSLVGLLYWVGFRRLEVPYVRQPRLVGTSAWGFRRKMR